MAITVPITIRARRVRLVVWLIRALKLVAPLLGVRCSEWLVNRVLRLLVVEYKAGRKWRRTPLNLHFTIKE